MMINEEVGIAQINDDAVLLRDNTLIAVLNVEPISYDPLKTRTKTKIDNIYRKWLDSLTYPVQIVSRRVNMDVKEQAKVIKNRVEYAIKQKEEYRDLLKLYKEFEHWLDTYLEQKAKSSTVYYLVIPVYSTKKLTKGLIKIKTNEDYKKELEKLNDRVKHAVESISLTGVKINRLYNAQLKNLYASYFEVNVYSDSYEMPEDWIRKWRSSDVLQKKQKD